MTFRGRESLAQFILRSPFCLEKLICQQQSKTVVYRSKMTTVLNQNFAIFPVLDCDSHSNLKASYRNRGGKRPVLSASRLRVDITPPYRMRSAPKMGVRGQSVF